MAAGNDMIDKYHEAGEMAWKLYKKLRDITEAHDIDASDILQEAEVYAPNWKGYEANKNEAK